MGSTTGDGEAVSNENSEELSQELYVKEDAVVNNDDEDSDDDEVITHQTHKKQSKKLLDSDDESDNEVPNPIFEFKSDKGLNSDENENFDAASTKENHDESREDNEKNGSDSDSSGSNDSDESSDDDDDEPPIRLFRSKDPGDRVEEVQAESEFDQEVDSFLSEESATPRQKTQRKSSKVAHEMMLRELKSESQRLIRESNLNLPYHVPENVSLSKFMEARRKLRNKTAFKDSKSDAVSDLSNANDKSKKKSSFDRVSALLRKHGKSLPELNLPKFKEHPEQMSVHMIEIVEEEKRVSSKAQLFKNNLLSHIKGSQKSKSDSVASKSQSLKGRQKVLEMLKLSMKKNREANRAKKEELRRLDNEEFDVVIDEDEEAEMTDPEDGEDDTNDVEIIDEEEEDPNLDSRGTKDEGDLNSCDKVENLNSSSFNEEFYDEDSNTKQDNDESLVLFNEKNKKTNDDSLVVEPSLPLRQNMCASSPKSVKDVNDCSFFDKLNAAGDSFMESNVDTSSQQSFNSQGFLKESPYQETRQNAISELMGAGDDNANDGQMGELLGLCTGKFVTQAEEKDNEDAKDGSLMQEESFVALGIDESTTTDAQTKQEKFKQETDFLSPIRKNRRQPPIGFLVTEDDDVIESRVSDSDEDDEEEMVIRRRKKPVAVAAEKNYFKSHEEGGHGENAMNFLENEAELSGDDDGEGDDDEGENNDYYEEDEAIEELPDEAIIHQQVNKAHQKQVLDEDKRELELLQEAFMEDDPIVRRKRRFRWKNIDESEFTQNLLNDADDDEDDDDKLSGDDLIDQESQWRTMRLERDEFLAKMADKDFLIDEESQVTKLGKFKIESSRSRMDSQFSRDSLAATSSSNSRMSFMKQQESFLLRGEAFHARMAKLPELQSGQGAVNSEKMIFKRKIPPETDKAKKRVKLVSSKPLLKSARRPQQLSIEENSNSVFDLFER